MNIYTIVATYSGVTVHDGKLARARMKYAGGNLEVYVKGHISIAMRDKVYYHAISLAQAHHIPLSQFRAYGWL